MTIKIISGGQTGVDRAALDFGLENGIEIGGYCPKGRVAEDGVISSIYPLTEMATSNYSDRTLKNIIESDATIIIYFGELEGGSLNTRNFCTQENKPFMLVNGMEKTPKQSSLMLSKFLGNEVVKVLNVAGSRASNCPKCYEYTKQVFNELLIQLSYIKK